MRPIDADAMYKRYCVDKSGLDGIYDTTDLPDMLGEMPTIDAIPVEWLKAHIKPYTGDVSDIGKSARNGTIKDLIRKWQKEQEAR